MHETEYWLSYNIIRSYFENPCSSAVRTLAVQICWRRSEEASESREVSAERPALDQRRGDCEFMTFLNSLRFVQSYIDRTFNDTLLPLFPPGRNDPDLWPHHRLTERVSTSALMNPSCVSGIMLWFLLTLCLFSAGSTPLRTAWPPTGWSDQLPSPLTCIHLCPPTRYWRIFTLWVVNVFVTDNPSFRKAATSITTGPIPNRQVSNLECNFILYNMCDSCSCRYTTRPGYTTSHTSCRPQWVFRSCWFSLLLRLKSLNIFSAFTLRLTPPCVCVCVCVSTGSRPDSRDGPHHVHPAHLDDGAPGTAAQPPLHGQQRHSESRAQS